MSVRTRLRALECQRRRAGLVACPQCRHAFAPEQYPATLPPLPPFEELRQLPYADLLRMYQERKRLDGTLAACCARCGEGVPLSPRVEALTTGQAEYERLRKLPYDELVKQYHELLGLDEEGLDEMSLRHRLKRLGQVRQDTPAIWLLCVDEQGLVLDDGSAEIRPFVGKHHSAVPSNPMVIADRLPAGGPRLHPARTDTREEV